MPVISRTAHNLIGASVLGDRLVIRSLTLIERAVIGVTQTDTQITSCLTIVCHRLLVVVPSRVDSPLLLEDGAYICIVDCLS